MSRDANSRAVVGLEPVIRKRIRGDRKRDSVPTKQNIACTIYARISISSLWIFSFTRLYGNANFTQREMGLDNITFRFRCPRCIINIDLRYRVKRLTDRRREAEVVREPTSERYTINPPWRARAVYSY